MAALRRKNIVLAPVLKQEDLIERYAIMWGRETAAHPAPQVFPGSAKSSGDKYPFFTAYSYCGLVPPSLIFSLRTCTHMGSISSTSHQMP